MPGSRSPSNPTRGSWRAKPAKAEPESRHVKRILATAAVLALCGLLAWIVWSLFAAPRQVHVACLPIADYNVLDAPSLPFVSQDLARWRRLDESPHTTVAVWDNLTEAPKLESSLAQQVRGVPAGHDVLILFVSAHGVSVTDAAGEATAWLLCSDYSATGGSGRYKLGDLLAHLARSTASTKLLVLDAGTLEVDVQTGMLLNEFPLLVEDEVRKLDDPSLWVLASHGLLERSHVSYHERSSVFAQCVAEALAGAADSDQDDNTDVDLAELFDYVSTRVGSWVWQASGQTQTQTPLLLRGEQGRGKPEPLPLTKAARPVAESNDAAPAGEAEQQARRPSRPLSRPLANAHGVLALGQAGSAQTPAAQAPTAQAPATQAPDTQPPAPGTQGADPATDTQPAASPPAGKTEQAPPPAGQAGQPAKKPGPAPPQPTAAELAQRGLLDLAWQQWQSLDGMDDRAGVDGWTPVDYAPHLWRQCEQLLLGYERQALGGTVPAEPAAVDLLKTRMRLDPYLERINRRRQEFDLGAAKTSFEQHPDVAAAIRLRNDVLFRAPSYVRLCGAAGVSAQSELGRRLADFLGESSRLVALFVESPGHDGSLAGQPAPDAKQWLAALVEQQQRVRSLQTDIELRLRQQAGFDQPSGPRRRAAAPGRYASQGQAAEALLNTHLPLAGQRRQLWDMLAAMDDKPPADDRLPSSSQRNTVAARNWQRIAQWAEWELKLTQVVDPGGVTPANLDLARSLAAARNIDAENVAAQCRAFREVGSALASFYRTLPAKVASNATADAYHTRRTAETMLRLIDGRDAQHVDLQFEGLALGGGINLVADLPLADLDLDTAPKVALSGPTAAQGTGEPVAASINAEQFTRFQWRLRHDRAREALIQLQYEAADLEITAPDGKPWPPGREQKLALTASGGEEPIALLVRARHGSISQTTLTLRARLSEESVENQTRFAVAAPDRLDLVATGPDGGTEPAAASASLPGSLRKLTLRPFPTGGTEFSLSVHNLSGVPKKLAYTLFALPPRGAAGPSAYSWNLDQPARPVPGARALLKTDLVFAGNVNELPLPLPPLTPAAPAAPAPAAGSGAERVGGGGGEDDPPPAAAATAADQEPKGIPAANGLLCLLDDAARPSAEARQWFWIDVAPRHPADYLLDPEVWYDRDRKRIVVRIRPKADQLLPPGGSRIVWQLEDPLLRSSQSKRTAAVLKPRVHSVELFAEVEPDRQRRIEVYLAVDDYPRAFIYSVLCDGPGQRVPRKLLALDHVEIVEPPEGQAFRDTPTVRVKLRADVPPPELEERLHEIVVAIPGDVDEHRFTTDRAFDVRLLKGDVEGTFTLLAAVGDLEVDLDTEAYPNQSIQISARLLRGGAALKTDRRTVKLDDQPPILDLVSGAAQAVRVRQGDDLRLAARAADDVSGVEQVEFAKAAANDTEIKDPKITRLPEDGGDLYAVLLPTKELEPGRYTFLVRAVDKVGLASPIEKLAVFIDKPLSTSPADSPTTNKLRVQVTFDGRPLAKKCKVSIIAGPKMLSKQTGSDGICEFTELPPGDYTVKAEGIAGNKEREGQQTVTVAAPPARPASTQIDLE